jgi:glycosyltransferase involved in cell wall biosynthesis
MMKKIAIVSTHPIQYNAPWFQLLAERGKVDLKVFYTWSQSKTTVKDKVFGKNIQWDIPLLEGYNYEFIDNVSKKPGSHQFFGIDNPELINALKNYQPEAILFFGWNFKSHLKAMRYFHGKIPVWFRGDSTLLDETAGYKTTLRRLVLTKVYKYVDKAFYVGEASKAYFLKHGLKEAQLVYAPHAIDNSRFGDDGTKNYNKEALQWRSELGYTADDIVIVFAGKLEPKKQPDFLMHAFNIANATRANASALQLLIVGNGPMETALKAKGQKNVKFIPFQNQTKMPLVYRLGDVLCLPSKGPGETWGLAVNEAMACGRPVIVSDKVGCSQDLVRHNRTGFIFKYDSLEALTALLVHLNTSVLLQMGATAQKKISDYSFLHIVEAIEGNILNFAE